MQQDEEAVRAAFEIETVGVGIIVIVLVIELYYP